MNTGFVALLLIASFALSSANLSCYQCTSLNPHESCLTKYEQHLTPCHNLTFGNFVNKEPIGCRKIIQSVQGQQSVVRECAYSGEMYNGKKISGTSEVQVLLYQCSGNGCNASVTPSTSIGVVLLSVVALIFRF